MLFLLGQISQTNEGGEEDTSDEDSDESSKDDDDDSTEEVEQGPLDNTNLEESNLEESNLEESGLLEESEPADEVVEEEDWRNELDERGEQREEKESEDMKIARNNQTESSQTSPGAGTSQASVVDDHASQWIHTFSKPQALR